MASFPTGTSIPRVWNEFGTSGTSPLAAISIWHNARREFCYLLWKTTGGDNEALSGYTGMKNVIFTVGFILHFWVLLFSSRLKASTNKIILKSSGRGRIKPFISTLIIAAAWVLEINTELGWKMETANATSYLISSIIVSVHVSVEPCLPLMQPIIAAMLTLRADLLLSKSRFVQGSSSPVSLSKIHCRDIKSPITSWLRISPFTEIIIHLLIHHLNSQYLCLVKRNFDTKIYFIIEDASSELSWNRF